MSDTRFTVVRHGETAWNAQGRIQGNLDSPLNEEGLAQAILLGERLARERFDAVYCSDLGRVLQTIQPFVDHTRIEPIRSPQLRERHLGVFQGLTSEECMQRYPDEYKRFHGREPDHAVPEGESIRQVYARVSSFFNQAAARHSGQALLIVTHGGILDALYRLVTNTPLDRRRDFPIYNASLNCVVHRAGRWLLDTWGDISHLTRDAALDDF
ncbi:MAG TPA: histidine phosphatase family protein [Burkholderiales bacterium]|nr:histidine phosphatase family protein [Burkholderiales bacterium]